MSDTPMTDDRIVYGTLSGDDNIGAPWVNAPFARQLERKLNAANTYIKRLEEVTQERDKEWFQVIESIFNFHLISMTEALKIGIDRMKNKNERIKQLEESENRMLNWLTEDCPESVKKQLSNAWMKSKEAKP